MPLPPDLSKPSFAIFPKAADNIINGCCAFCAKKLTKFRDKLSEREYSISGLCQSCQDEAFAPDADHGVEKGIEKGVEG